MSEYINRKRVPEGYYELGASLELARRDTSLDRPLGDRAMNRLVVKGYDTPELREQHEFSTESVRLLGGRAVETRVLVINAAQSATDSLETGLKSGFMLDLLSDTPKQAPERRQSDYELAA